MRFNSNAYDKLFPRKEAEKPIESVVDTFRPTSANDGREVESSEPVNEYTDSGGDSDGGDSESDTE